MCTKSKINEMLPATGSASAPSVAKAESLSAVKLKHDRNAYYLIDIRESDEIEAMPVPKEFAVDAAMPMGKIFNVAEHGSNAFDDWKVGDKKIVLLCETGIRAALTIPCLTACGLDAAYLTRGLLGLHSPAAIVPDFVVVLGVKDNAEKLTLALNACAAAATSGETTVLVLMGDGVCTFLRKGNNKDIASENSFRVEETFIGEPFKPCHALLTKFIGSGNGVILGCSSCVKSRKIEFGSDLIDCVEPMQMPDLIRMLGEAKKSLQFI